MEAGPQKLPSSRLLNLCVQLYFRQAEDMWPLVHRPTFHLSNSNSALVLSMCAKGSLFAPLTSAQNFGADLFERLQKASLLIWETALDRSPEEGLALVQASVIGQGFGCISGGARYLAQNDAFQGTVISWARRIDAFNARHQPTYQLGDIHGEELQRIWMEWVHVEEKIRITLQLRLTDKKLAMIFAHEPLLRHNTNFVVVASDELFNAPTAEDWREKYMHAVNTGSLLNIATSDAGSITISPTKMMTLPYHPYLSLYALLGGMSVMIFEARLAKAVDEAMTATFTEQLSCFRKCYLNAQSRPYRIVDLQILWHITFMELSTDFTCLELPLSREAFEPPSSLDKLMLTWKRPEDMIRCLIHGESIMRVLEAQPFTRRLGLNTLRSLFLTGVAWFSAARLLSNLDSEMISRVLNYPEMKYLDTGSKAFAARLAVDNIGKSKISDLDGLLFRAIEQLQIYGAWLSARKYLTDLNLLIDCDLGLGSA